MSETIVWFLIWGALIFLMMRFGCGAHVMGHGGHGAHGEGRWPPSREPREAVDPVCGMTVATRDAKTSLYEGRVYYFCSQNCREKFEASPASYGIGTGETPRQMEGHHHG
jgi:YHS domain-containing protein